MIIFMSVYNEKKYGIELKICVLINNVIELSYNLLTVNFFNVAINYHGVTQEEG